MSQDGVNIPVRVVGGDQAKAELAGVRARMDQLKSVQTGAGAVRQDLSTAQRNAEDLRIMERLAKARGDVAGASQLAAQAVTQEAEAQRLATVVYGDAARASGLLGAETGQLTRHGQMLAMDALMLVNPELSLTFRLLSHLALGVGSLTPTLLALAGGAAVVGGVAAAFKSVAEAADRAAQAVKRAKDAMTSEGEKGLEQRYELTKTLAGLGLYGREAQAQSASIAMQTGAGRGQIAVPAELAMNAAVAEQVAKTEGVAFDRERYFAGLTTRGMKPPEFTDRRKAGGQIADILKAGESDAARRAWQSYRKSVRDYALTHAPSDAGLVVDPLDVAAGQMKSGMEESGFTKEEQEAALAIARAYRTAATAQGGGPMRRIPQGGVSAYEDLPGVGDIFGKAKSHKLGGRGTPEQLANLAQRMISTAARGGEITVHPVEEFPANVDVVPEHPQAPHGRQAPPAAIEGIELQRPTPASGEGEEGGGSATNVTHNWNISVDHLHVPGDLKRMVPSIEAEMGGVAS